MLRCDLERSALVSIKLVSDNLCERLKLDCFNAEDCSHNPAYSIYEKPEDLRRETLSVVKKEAHTCKSSMETCRKGKSDTASASDESPVLAYGSEFKEADLTMNNSLMFRSMFFMNDDARHFLAPPLPLPPCESEYFQKKITASSSALSSNNIGSQSNSGTVNQVQSGSVEKSISVPKQRPHNCEECGKTFLMKHHLVTHMRVHTGERPHVCPECGKSFALKHCLSTHLLLHSADRPYKCTECNKSFTLKHHLVSHERVHSRDRPFECPECGQRFPQKRHLTTHIKFHSGERPFSCQVCGESFSREEHLVMHSRFHGGQSPYICPDCGAGFPRKFELVNHERQHGRNPESCPACGKEFLQKRTLLVHIRTCGLPPPPITPPTQSPSPPQYSDSSSGSGPNKTCKECGETFASVEGLALHLRLHFGDHSFLSDICSLAASLKQSAVNVAAAIASKKTHFCTDCGRGFTQKHGLFQHRQRHADASCKLKPFACEKCGKCFAQKNHLSLHERQHMDLPSNRSSPSISLFRLSQSNRQDSIIQTSPEQQQRQHDQMMRQVEDRHMEHRQSDRQNADSMARQPNDHQHRSDPMNSTDRQHAESLLHQKHSESLNAAVERHRLERQHAEAMMRHQQEAESLNTPPPDRHIDHRILPVPLIRQMQPLTLSRQGDPHMEAQKLLHHHLNPSPPLDVSTQASASSSSSPASSSSCQHALPPKQAY